MPLFSFKFKNVGLDLMPITGADGAQIIDVKDAQKEVTVPVALLIAALDVQVDKLPLEKAVQSDQLVIKQVRKYTLEQLLLWPNVSDVFL